ncbi:SPARC-like protein 1 [Frankliniella fusca]|uniref:SPARC-like protein 1 n=1 Tax=Frankliniella fusca TaxID=407009 RepID=A0AAE1HFF6_9NEOP|nr:SPARC-like protein 1 [Frankliniella fusca]
MVGSPVSRVLDVRPVGVGSGSYLTHWRPVIRRPQSCADLAADRTRFSAKARASASRSFFRPRGIMGLLRACLALAVVVPVALALSRCPCPAAPAAARVCGSDLKTHDSQCHLMECADHAGPRGRAARDTRSADDVDEYRLSDVTDRVLALSDLNDYRDLLMEVITEQPAAGGTGQPETLVRFVSPLELSRSWTPNLGDDDDTGHSRTLVGRGAAAVGLAVFYGCYRLLRCWLCRMLDEEPAHV